MFESMKGMADTVRKVNTQHPMQLEELHALLSQRVNPSQFGIPELKKGLFGKSITYPKVHRVIPTITVKGNQVTIRRVQDDSKTTVSVGKVGFAMDKDLRGKAGMDTMKGGTEYFQAIADAITAALSDQ